MTGPRPLVDAFRTDDPLFYPELSQECGALRALLAVLADTGATVLYRDPGMLPRDVDLWIAGGFTLIHHWRDGPEPGQRVLSAQWGPVLQRPNTAAVQP